MVITPVMLLDAPRTAEAEKKTVSVEKQLNPAPIRKEPAHLQEPAPQPRTVAQPAPAIAAARVEPSADKTRVEEPPALRPSSNEHPAQGETAQAAPTFSTQKPMATQGNNPAEARTEAGSGKKTVDELAKFKAFVVGKIERVKNYPKWARERGYEGVVKVMFTINPDGSVNGLKVVQPCICDVLNKAACEAVEKAGPFPMPKTMEAKAMAMELTVPFKLKD